MTKTAQLNSLFKKWRNSSDEFRENFYPDGIIDEAMYETQDLKILFVCKEPNKGNHLNEKTHDFREQWRGGGGYYNIAFRLAEWTTGIQNDFRHYARFKESTLASEEAAFRQALRSIAFMNIKKSSGSGVSDKKEMREKTKPVVGLVKKQIDIIAPDLIILGLSWSSLRDQLFPELAGNWIDSGWDVAVARSGKAKVIDFYHPSSRNVPAASLALLEKVMKGKAFVNL